MILPVPDMATMGTFPSVDGNAAAGKVADSAFGLLVNALTEGESLADQPTAAVGGQEMPAPQSARGEGMASLVAHKEPVAQFDLPEVQVEAPQQEEPPLSGAVPEAEQEQVSTNNGDVPPLQFTELAEEAPQLPEHAIEPEAPAEAQIKAAVQEVAEQAQSLAPKPSELPPAKTEVEQGGGDNREKRQPPVNQVEAGRSAVASASASLNAGQTGSEAGETEGAGRQQQAESAGVQPRLPTAERADSSLPSQLLSQALPAVPSRPAGNPYPVQAQTLPPSPVVVAQPGRLGADIGVEIARAVKGNQDDLLIRLDPREMGRIDVRLSFDRDGVMRAVMSAESPAALDLLRRESGDLNRALADAGIRSDGQSLRFDARSGEGAGQGGQRWDQDRRGGSHGGTDSSGGDVVEPQYRPIRASGQVDLIA